MTNTYTTGTTIVVDGGARLFRKRRYVMSILG